MSTPAAPARGRFERAAWWALVATIAVFPLAVAKFPWSDVPLTYTAFAFPQTVALTIGLAMVLLLWTIALLLRETTLVLSWRLIPFGAFLAWAAVATVGALEPLRALFGKSSSALSLTGIAGLTALLFLVVQLTGSRQRLLTLTRTVCYSATTVALLALVQQVFNADPFGLPEVADWMLGRGFSTLGNPDYLGTFLVLPAVLLLGLALAEDDTARRALAFSCLGVTTAAMIGTLTRGAWLGVALGVLGLAVPVWLFASGHRRLISVSAAVLLAGSVVALAAADTSDLKGRFSTEPAAPVTAVDTSAAETMLSGRLELWRIALDIAADRPLVGTGPASYELGWYPRAESETSLEGNVAIGDDPHSLYFTALATTGFPGLLALLASIGATLVFAVRSCASLLKRQHSSAAELLYVAWTAAALGLLAALAAGAVTTPIAALTFVALGVLVRPGAKASSAEAPRLVAVGVGLVLALTLTGALVRPLAAERELMRAAVSGQGIEDARAQVAAVPWNQDVQSAYCRLRVAETEALLSRSPASAAEPIRSFASQLAQAGAVQPYEYLYPSVRAHILTRASELLGPAEYAGDAVAAADDALAIMPASIPVRVDKALALSDLGEYEKMAETLEGYWESETGSSYPGIVYAQALALSGRAEEAWAVFDVLTKRFPGDGSVEAARQQTQGLLQQ